MQVRIDPSALRPIKWYEYVVRLLFGGLITAATGIIAKEYGPAIGGLFMAFPAIFPAAATLVEKHEKQRKHRLGLHGSRRGREAASLDAAGAARGSIALLVFGLLVWRLMPTFNASVVLVGSALAWLVISGLLWRTRHLTNRLRRKERSRTRNSL
jgi:uncharacterized protein DUF3147